MKRTTKAFLLSFLLLASPATAGKGGQDNRAERGQARIERQAARQNQQAQRAARRMAAAERNQARAERRQARAERPRARAARQQAAQARQERGAERREATAARQQRRLAQQDRRQERAVTQRVIRQQREAQQQRIEQRQQRRERAIDRAERRQAVRSVRDVRRDAQRNQTRAERRAMQDERRIVRDQRRALRDDRVIDREQRRALRNDRSVARPQRQAVREDRMIARQRQALRAERFVSREQRRQTFVAAQRFDREQRRAFRQERLRMQQQPRYVWDGPRRFRGLDFDHDGAIARFEWRGNDRSFRNHDWNRDGILSGVEVTPGGRRFARFERFPFVERFVPLPRRMVAPVPLLVGPVTAVQFVPLPPLHAAFPVGFGFDESHFERVVRVQGFGPVTMVVERVQLAPVDRVLIDDRFIALDLDRDRFVSFDEWSGPRPLFRQLDVNDDRRLFADELVLSNPGVRTVTMVDRDRYVAFALLDQDDDGVIAPWEWTGDMDVFFRLDVNGDSLVDQSEYLGLVRVRPVPVRMIANGTLDLDHDGCVSRSEWVGDPYRFVSLDLNGDGRVKPVEAVAGALLTTQL